MIQSPFELHFEKNMEPFRIREGKRPAYSYRIGEAGRSELEGSRFISKRKNYGIYQSQEQTYRVWERKEKGERIRIILKKSRGETGHELLLSEGSMKNAGKFLGKDIMAYLGMEDMWLINNAFLLHASCVRYRGKGILFSACSGKGKSTQARLWEEYEGAEVLNGDRTLVRREEGKWKAYGSPLAGSSRIYRNQSAPVRGIMILTQGEENRIQKLSGKEAFIPLYRETLMNSWNPEYMEAMTDLLLAASKEIPIYHLSCRPDKESVELVKRCMTGNKQYNNFKSSH